MKMRYSVIYGLIAMGLALAQPASAGTACDDHARFPEVSGDELQKLVDQKEAFVVDVNSADSYKQVHVTGAVHYGTTPLARILPKEKNALIVAYCGGPKCGAWKKAAAEACEMGYTNIRHYKGGLQDWKKRSQKI